MDISTVKKLVDEAERTYNRCWDTLVSLRQGEPGPDLPSFQHELGRAMQALEDAYQRLARRRQELIDRKATIASGWFSREQARLDRHQKLVHGAMGVGYSLGDAFAWYFYQFDRPLLDQHAAHEHQTHPASGVGGQAELAALAALLATGRYIPIYHGITTILRMGDITLVDMKYWRVAAIGEVKTTKPDATGSAEATVTFIGHRDDFPLDDFSRRVQSASRRETSGPLSIPERESAPRASQSAGLSSGQTARLKRQLKRTQDGMDGARKASSAPRSGLQAAPTPLQLLDDLARGSRRGRTKFRRVDGGLVALVYRSRFRSLFYRLARAEQLDPSGFPAEAMAPLRETIVKGSAWNHVLLGIVHYGSDGLPVLPLGTLPVLWWPVDSSLSRDIVFHTVKVFTVWNPAPLLQRLEGAGFEVDPGGLPHRLHLTRRAVDGRRLSYVDDWFSKLIPAILAREEDVVAMILRFWDHAQHDTVGGKRIQLRAVHEYFSDDAISAMRRRRSPARGS